MAAAPALDVHRLGVVVHPTRDVDRALETVRAWAEEREADLVQVGVHGRSRDVAPRAEPEGCDLLVAVGGDGTVLGALRAASATGIPVLGVACGSLGALTAVDPDGLEEALGCVAGGDWLAREVPAIVVTPATGEPVRAFNDLVVVRAAGSQVVAGVDLDGQPYARWAGDGVVAATPFGSTAYNLALGGPLLAPGTQALVVAPIAPHGGSVPALVTPAGAVLELAVEGGHGGYRVELDGRPAELDASALQLELEPHAATLVRFEHGEPFLAGLRRRGIVADSPRVVARDAREAKRVS